MALVAIVVLNLGVATASSAYAAQGNGRDLCVAISGGEVSNATVLDIATDGGTGIADTSGGNGNAAVASETNNDNGNGNNDNRNGNNGNGNNGNGNGNNGNGNNGNGNGNNGNGNNGNGNNGNGNGGRNDWASAETVRALEVRLQQDTASSGNGGVATASADGGVVSVEDINSGGNVGNAIAVGDTVCAGAAHSPSGGGRAGGGNVIAGGGNAGGGRGGQVRALPSTGVGLAATDSSGTLFLAFGALSLLVFALGNQRQVLVSRARGR